ncbi:murein L,D-transpeptidase family protein [Roseibacillus persicicus]|uniref:L,D-transpeptidase family protein n=1 Tax=Roseibacillus persicicus TaxID=454148 RepID=UPI00398B4906
MMGKRLLKRVVLGFVLCLATLAAVNGDEDRAAKVALRVGPTLSENLEGAGLSMGSPVFIRVFKEERELELWLKKGDLYQLFRTYPIAAMSGELGPKLAEGDRQAPEGFYFVPSSAMNPRSAFHLSFNIGYPNAYDRAHGRTGTFIMVHGDRQSIGCFAMTDEKIEEIYTLCNAALKNGQPFFRVHCFPFRMSVERMKRAEGHRWESFWKELQSGYDWFEEKKVPPNVEVREKRYQFGPIRGEP